MAHDIKRMKSGSVLLYMFLKGGYLKYMYMMRTHSQLLFREVPKQSVETLPFTIPTDTITHNKFDLLLLFTIITLLKTEFYSLIYHVK